MRYASVVLDGHRRAALIEGDTARVSNTVDLDQALVDGLDSLNHRASRTLPTADLIFDVPLRPPVVFCAGQNYRDHLDEKAPAKSKDLEFFLKAGQTIARLDDPLVLDARVTKKLDYETELGIVIGRSGRHITANDALKHVAGYVIVNDVTARDRQVVKHEDGSSSMALGPGKNFDGSTRLGQYMTSTEDVRDPNNLRLRTWVNDELRQDNNTANMLVDIANIVAWVSRLLTLTPGTVIATGTPGGTGWGTDPELGGTSKTPPGCVPARYLSAGDSVTSSIELIGECGFTIVKG